MRQERTVQASIFDIFAAHEIALTALGVRRGKAALSSGCKPHPANSLQPEAIGAVMEVTKWLKPSNSGHNW